MWSITSKYRSVPFVAQFLFSQFRKPPCGRMYSISGYLNFHFRRLRFWSQHRAGTFVSVLHGETWNTSSIISINGKPLVQFDFGKLYEPTSIVARTIVNKYMWRGSFKDSTVIYLLNWVLRVPNTFSFLSISLYNIRRYNSKCSRFWTLKSTSKYAHWIKRILYFISSFHHCFMARNTGYYRNGGCHHSSTMLWKQEKTHSVKLY